MAQKPDITVLSILWLDPRKLGSLEEYTVFLSRALQRRGWRGVVAFANPTPEPLTKLLEGAGAIVEVFDPGRQSLKSNVMRLRRKYRADIVHFHFVGFFSWTLVQAKLAGAKEVIVSERIRFPRQLNWWNRCKLVLWDRLVLATLGVRVLAVSDFIKRTLVTSYALSPERIQVVYNGINLERFTLAEPGRVVQGRKQEAIPEGWSVVTCVAGLIPEKGVGDYLAAAKKVLAKRPNTMFLAVGEGPLAAALKQEAWDLGIGDNVRFTGSRSDVQHLMAIADVIVVPSVCEEAAGFVVMEGMAVGRAIVATRVGGIPEYLEEGVTGVLVERSSPGQIAENILRLLERREVADAMGRAGRKRVEDRFSMERWVGETMALYARALGMEGQESL